MDGLVIISADLDARPMRRALLWKGFRSVFKGPFAQDQRRRTRMNNLVRGADRRLFGRAA